MFDTRSNFHDDDAARRPADPAAVAVLIADSDNQKDHNVKVDTDCWDENQPTSINSDGDLENYNDGNICYSQWRHITFIIASNYVPVALNIRFPKIILVHTKGEGNSARQKIFIVDQEDNPLPRLLDHLSVALYNDVFAVN